MPLIPSEIGMRVLQMLSFHFPNISLHHILHSDAENDVASLVHHAETSADSFWDEALVDGGIKRSKTSKTAQSKHSIHRAHMSSKQGEVLQVGHEEEPARGRKAGTQTLSKINQPEMVCFPAFDAAGM